jgi:hypothetical protein
MRGDRPKHGVHRHDGLLVAVPQEAGRQRRRSFRGRRVAERRHGRERHLEEGVAAAAKALTPDVLAALDAAPRDFSGTDATVAR